MVSVRWYGDCLEAHGSYSVCLESSCDSQENGQIDHTVRVKLQKSRHMSVKQMLTFAAIQDIQYVVVHKSDLLRNEKGARYAYVAETKS